MVLGSSPVAVTSTSDFAPASSKEFLDIQATIGCGFTLKHVRDMIRTYSHSESCLQEHLFRHFSSPGHNGFLNDVSVTFINKTDPSDPLKCEKFCRETFMFMAPYGLNIISFCKIIIDTLGQDAHCFVSFFIIDIEKIIV